MFDNPDIFGDVGVYRAAFNDRADTYAAIGIHEQFSAIRISLHQAIWRDQRLFDGRALMCVFGITPYTSNSDH